MRSEIVKKLLTPSSVGQTDCGCKATIIKNDLDNIYDIVAIIEVLPKAWQRHAKKREIITQFSSNSANDHYAQLLSNPESGRTISLNLKSFERDFG